MDDIYKVLPGDDDFTIDELEMWKIQFDSLSSYLKKVSNEISVARYGFDNITRYNELKKRLYNNLDPKIDLYDDSSDFLQDNTETSSVVILPEESAKISHILNVQDIRSLSESDLSLIYKAAGLVNCIDESYGKYELQLEAVDIDNTKKKDLSKLNLDPKPIYVALFTGARDFKGNVIRKFTNSIFSHSAVSLEPSLDHIYSYSFERDKDTNKPVRCGFTEENKRSFLMVNGMMKVKLFAIFIDKQKRSKIVATIKKYLANKEKTSYNAFSIISIAVGRALKKSTSNPYSMICSQFVYTILSMANIHMNINKKASLVSPADLDRFIDDTCVFTVYDDKLIDYKPSKINNIVKKIYEEKICKQNIKSGKVLNE